MPRSRSATLCREILTGFKSEHTISALSSAGELAAALDGGERFELLIIYGYPDGGRTGMELARDPRAENEQTSILFIASSQECLKDGYSVRPIQYLYKPVDRAELAQALETNLCLHHRPDRVTLRLGSKTSVLPLDTLLYAKSQSHGTVAAFPNGQLRKHSRCRRHCRAQQEKRSIHDRIRFTAQSSYPLLFGMIVPRCWASPHSSFWQRHLYLLYFPWSQPAPEHFVTFSWGGP